MWGQKSYLTKAVCMQVCSHTWMQMPINTGAKSPQTDQQRFVWKNGNGRRTVGLAGTRKMPTIKMVVISRKIKFFRYPNLMGDQVDAL